MYRRLSSTVRRTPTVCREVHRGARWGNTRPVSRSGLGAGRTTPRDRAGQPPKATAPSRVKSREAGLRPPSGFRRRVPEPARTSTALRAGGVGARTGRARSDASPCPETVPPARRGAAAPMSGPVWRAEPVDRAGQPAWRTPRPVSRWSALHRACPLRTVPCRRRCFNLVDTDIHPLWTARLPVSHRVRHRRVWGHPTQPARRHLWPRAKSTRLKQCPCRIRGQPVWPVGYNGEPDASGSSDNRPAGRCKAGPRGLTCRCRLSPGADCAGHPA